MPVVCIPSLLRSLTGGQERVTLPGGTVGEVVENLEQRYPGIRARLFQGERLRRDMSLLVDGTLSTRGLLQAVGEDSEIRFIPSIEGGTTEALMKYDSTEPIRSVLSLRSVFQ